jgi:hypothetical protein
MAAFRRLMPTPRRGWQFYAAAAERFAAVSTFINDNCVPAKSSNA